jgi:hypothetical protein
VEGKQSRVLGQITDFAFLFFTLLLNLMTWIPYIRNGLTSSQIGYPSFGQDQMHYVARAHAIWQGKESFAAFTSTSSGITDGLGNFAEYIFFLPSKLFFLDRLTFPIYFYSVLVLSTYVSLAACYYFFKFLMQSRVSAGSLTIIFIFFSQFIDLSGVHFPGVPIFNRWPTPMLHYFLVFVFLRILIDSHVRYRKILGALIFASSFYLYLYTWQTIAALLISALIIRSISKNLVEVKALLAIVFGGAFFALPAILAILQLLISSKSDSLLRFAFRQQDSHMPGSDKMSYVLCLISLVAWFQRKNINRKILDFITLCALGGLIVSNQQIITGKVLQPGHFHWYFIAPAFFVCSAILLFSIVAKLRESIPLLMALSVIFTINQIQAMPAVQEEAKSQVSTGLSASQVNSLKGVVFTQDLAVLDQLATSYEDGLYWHPFGIYYNGSRDIAVESVLFSTIWLGPNSPIKFNPLRIHCIDFQVDPCSTARMLLGSESNMDWFEFVANPNLVERALYKPGSGLAKSLLTSDKDSNRYFKKVLVDRNIQTLILKKPATQRQLELIGSNWRQISADEKFWIYIRKHS